ncbi:MAG TPA: TolC family protein [Cyclobacteriaceae bacterium]|nr:TolC family protein [Cyclobacteriaceae bacterium]
MDNTRNILKYGGLIWMLLAFAACVPTVTQKTANRNVPGLYSNGPLDTLNTARVSWKEFFTDPYLHALIDTALRNNQELNIIMREISIAQNDVRARKGEYLPFVDLFAGAGVEKVARYTRDGSVEANSEIEPGKEFPDPLPDFMLAANFSWQVDIWKKLRNAKQAALLRYLATTEGRNFTVTRLVAEIADSYYELMALDNQLDILRKNIEIQTNALEIVKMEKTAARVTELAVRRFEAEVLKNQSRIFHVQQEIVFAENRINFLVGRFPQHIERNSLEWAELTPKLMQEGIPSQLLQNRPDIRQAELALAAAHLDVKSAKANFYPTFNITSTLGLQAFNATYLFSKPESMMYNAIGGLGQPLVNRNAIKAMYMNANARQVQAAYNYERTILNAYIEVTNQIANISNMKSSYDLRVQQVLALTQSIDISTRLFRSARADYMEVLLTQRDALESKFELVETKKQQMIAMVNVYQALGGGWN